MSESLTCTVNDNLGGTVLLRRRWLAYLAPMCRFLCIVLSVLAVSSSASADSALAMAAYEAKQFGRCAALSLAEADAQKGEAAAGSLYDAACCQAMGGQVDQAFATLKRA